ncbi:hypothetical protein [Clostridium sp. AWRP]|uniref:hypothetical protein n=1 Tax=Clostridium sp. AWRP TaxID=2212991 RepID=UPI000FDCC2E7|nr:hypothetical protein [Clostridium sp. AWRP]AZV57882.1 hypothetical protein DMR38_15415 [Clostridium sp. AWRP]
MKINIISNTMINNMKHKANSTSTGKSSPLDKEKLQLQQQMKKIEESDVSEETKDESIKEIQKRLLEEKSNKLDKKSETKEDTKQETEEEAYDKSQGINKEIMMGLMSASFHQRNGRVAYSEYKKAKAKGNMGQAEIALNYTSSEIKKTSQSAKLIQKGIGEYKKQLDKIKKKDNPVKSTENKPNADDRTVEVHNKVDSKEKNSDNNTIQVKGETSVKKRKNVK